VHGPYQGTHKNLKCPRNRRALIYAGPPVAGAAVVFMWASGVVPCTSCPGKRLHLLPVEAVAVTKDNEVSLTVYDDCTNGAFPVQAECVCSECGSEQDLLPTCFGGILCIQHAMAHCAYAGTTVVDIVWRQAQRVRQTRCALVRELRECLHAANKGRETSSSISIRLARAMQTASRFQVAFLSIAEKYGWAGSQFSSPVDNDWLPRMIVEIEAMQL
jgi:hypothetical protein